MSQEGASPPRADTGVASAASGIYPSRTASFSSSSSSSSGGVEEYSSYENFYDVCLLDLIFGDPVEDKIDALFEEELFRAAGASRVRLRQMAALREEERVAMEALRWRFAAQRKASRDRTKALRREATRKDEGLRRLTEYTDLLEADVSRYTDAQLAEYKQDLDRRSRELFGGGGA